MDRLKSLANGIGGLDETKKFYDQWANTYDETLNQWKYTVPKKAINLLIRKLKYQPKKILDLACGTGLFGEELIRIYKKCQIYGSDISQKSLNIAREKKLYISLSKVNFEKKIYYKSEFDLVSMIGAMTYCNNFNKLFSNIKFYLSRKGYFIFSHRVDLWEKQEFYKILDNLKIDFKVNFISKPYNYLPLNKDFENKIKIRLVLLQKY